MAVTGGFRYTLTPDPTAYPDAWSTAQCIRAIIVSNHDLRPVADKLRDAFKFILTERVQNNQQVPRVGIGWVTIPDEQINPPKKITRTEISAWVTLAYAAALRSRLIWTEHEQAATALRTFEGLAADLIARQDDGGAWGPHTNQSLRRPGECIRLP